MYNREDILRVISILKTLGYKYMFDKQDKKEIEKTIKIINQLMGE